MKKIIKIKPCDNLFLGSGKKLMKNENSWIRSKSIPNSSVFQGAICSLILANNIALMDKYKQNDPREYLTIKNIYIYNEKNKKIYIQAPVDILKKRFRDGFDYLILKKIEKEFNTSVSEMEYLFFNKSKQEVTRCDGMFINIVSLLNAYSKTNVYLDIINYDEIFSSVYKVGIERNEKNVVKEGQLYRLDLAEFKDNTWSYLVEYETKDYIDEEIQKVDKSGYLKLGGENKACLYEFNNNFDFAILDKLKEVKNENEFIKIVITAPCIFEEGVYKPKFKDIRVVAACTNIPEEIGGYDTISKAPKPMQKNIMPGSVYILKSDDFKDKTYEEIKEILENDLPEEKEMLEKLMIFPVNQKQVENKESILNV